MAEPVTTPATALKIIAGVDAARRVGWAKAFTAEEKIEQLSRDLNMACSDRDLYRAKLSELAGFITEYLQLTRQTETYGVISNHPMMVAFHYDDEHRQKGQALGRRLAARFIDVAKVANAGREVLAQAKADVYSKVVAKENRTFAHQHGFDSLDQLRRFLHEHGKPFLTPEMRKRIRAESRRKQRSSQ